MNQFSALRGRPHRLVRGVRIAAGVGLAVVLPAAWSMSCGEVESDDGGAGVGCAGPAPITCDCCGEPYDASCNEDGWYCGYWCTCTTPDCEADLSGGADDMAQCSHCVGDFCCSQALAYVADPSNRQAYWSLYGCADSYFGCEPACTSLLCNVELKYAFFHECAECTATYCCSEFEACGNRSACRDSCLYGETPASCCASGSEYLAYDECVTAYCQGVCPWKPCDQVGTGGNGSGGTGGSGGSAAAAGHGGSAGAAGHGGSAGTGGAT